MKTIGLLSFAMVAALVAGCSNDTGKAVDQARQSKPATEATSGAANGAADLTSQDAKDFIHHVATVDMAEIDLGKLAVDRGTAAEVKKFGQMMIGDHAASTDKLKALASDLKVEVPRELDEKHIDQRNKLSTESGADFDRAYADAMVDGHKDLIEQLEPRIDKKGLEQWKADMKGKTGVSDGSVAILPDKSDNKTTMRLNQFAASIYPTVHAHLEAAEALKSSIEKRGTTGKRGTTQ